MCECEPYPNADVYPVGEHVRAEEIRPERSGQDVGDGKFDGMRVFSRDSGRSPELMMDLVNELVEYGQVQCQVGEIESNLLDEEECH